MVWRAGSGTVRQGQRPEDRVSHSGRSRRLVALFPTTYQDKTGAELPVQRHKCGTALVGARYGGFVLVTRGLSMSGRRDAVAEGGTGHPSGPGPMVIDGQDGGRRRSVRRF